MCAHSDPGRTFSWVASLLTWWFSLATVLLVLLLLFIGFNSWRWTQSSKELSTDQVAAMREALEAEFGNANLRIDALQKELDTLRDTHLREITELETQLTSQQEVITKLTCVPAPLPYPTTANCNWLIELLYQDSEMPPEMSSELDEIAKKWPSLSKIANDKELFKRLCLRFPGHPLVSADTYTYAPTYKVEKTEPVPPPVIQHVSVPTPSIVVEHPLRIVPAHYSYPAHVSRSRCVAVPSRCSPMLCTTPQPSGNRRFRSR